MTKTASCFCVGGICADVGEVFDMALTSIL
jgi:hypothetical protein